MQDLDLVRYVAQRDGVGGDCARRDEHVALLLEPGQVYKGGSAEVVVRDVMQSCGEERYMSGYQALTHSPTTNPL